MSAPKGTAARLSSGEGANWLRYAPPVDLPPLDSEADEGALLRGGILYSAGEAYRFNGCLLKVVPRTARYLFTLFKIDIFRFLHIQPNEGTKGIGVIAAWARKCTQLRYIIGFIFSIVGLKLYH